jgi:hypothetical protein
MISSHKETVWDDDRSALRVVLATAMSYDDGFESVGEQGDHFERVDKVHDLCTKLSSTESSLTVALAMEKISILEKEKVPRQTN